MDIAINELSFEPSAESVAIGMSRMSNLLLLVKAVTQSHTAVSALRVSKDIFYCNLARDYPLSKWMNDARVKDTERVLFKTLCAKAPYLETILLRMCTSSSMQYRFEHLEHPAIGLGVAHLMDVPALSLSPHEIYNQDVITIHMISERESFVDDSIVEVCNISSQEQLGSRDEWIKSRIADSNASRTGMHAWENRNTLWPSIVFSDSLRRVIESFGSTDRQFALILRHLDALNAQSARWASGHFSLSDVPWSQESNATMNNDRYREMRTILFPDGNYRVCAYHTKMYEYNARIYFFPDVVARKAYIGYIGRHLPCVKYPT
jgi:hypothetical protein